MKFRNKVAAAAVGITIPFMFTGCVSDIASMASDIGTIATTGSMGYNMMQDIKISGVVKKDAVSKVKNLKSVTLRFTSSNWYGISGTDFTSAIETELMKQGIDVYENQKSAQAYVKGSVTISDKYDSTFGSIESKVKITGVNFKIVDKKSSKTLASIVINYKKGVDSIEAAKDVAIALKALSENPNKPLEKSFEELKKKQQG